MSPTVVCVGLTTIDLAQDVGALPGINEKVVASGLRLDVGGPAANAARVALRLGCRVRLVTALGGSDLAEMAVSRLAGIEIVDIAPTGHELPVSTILVTPDGGRSIISRNATALGAASLPSTSVLADADVVLHDGHLIEASIALAADPRPIQLLDGGSWKPGLAGLLPLLDIAVVSADFALPGHAPDESLTGLAGYGIPRLARSRGAEPVIAWIGERQFSLDVPQVPVVDSTGAGDVLHGALAAHLAHGHDFTESLRRAIEQASASVGGRGALHGLAPNAP